eukprot:2754426-Ditylum_brightwellii.AAC.1
MKARRWHQFKKLLHNLVAVAELCDAGCHMTFDPTEVMVSRDNKTLVQGWRDSNTKLWRIPIVDKEPTSTEHTQLLNAACATQEEYGNAAVQLVTDNYTMHMANSVYDCSTQEQLIKFYHSTMFSPVKRVLIKAARRKYLQGWPGFTQAAICKHIDVEEATVKGHLNQARQGVQSTKVEEPEC